MTTVEVKNRLLASRIWREATVYALTYGWDDRTLAECASFSAKAEREVVTFYLMNSGKKIRSLTHG
jgi:hypothetical protein